MSDKKEMEFVSGVYPKKRYENTPNWAIGKFSINRHQLMEWLVGRNEEWITIDMKESKDPNKKPYAYIDTWKPEKKEETPVRDSIEMRKEDNNADLGGYGFESSSPSMDDIPF